MTGEDRRRGKGARRWAPLFSSFCPKSGAVLEGLTECIIELEHMCAKSGKSFQFWVQKAIFESGLGKEWSKQCYHNASSLPWRAVITRDL